MRYYPYSPDVEVKAPNEDELIDRIVTSMSRVNTRAFDKHRHATRDAHAKSHGIVKGYLEIYDHLPEHLAQGLFASPKRYPVVIRYSTAFGQIKDDDIPSAYGMAVKVIGVEGEKILPEHQNEVTQDFLLVNFPVIPFGHVKAYWNMQRVAELQDNTPNFLKELGDSLTKPIGAIAGAVIPKTSILKTMGTLHILGETFYSMAAIRYGDYIAKISAAPLSPAVTELTGKTMELDGRPSGIRDLVVDFFNRSGAEYELRAQLCTHPAEMPIEDASIEWDEDKSHYQPIGKIVIPSQHAYSPARRVYGDDVLSFNPWHCLVEHQPLGSINRVRIPAYARSSKFRHDMNMQPRKEPRDIMEVPD
ncbi:catalase family protein [Alkanindiges sp. WGS2144]|uniref:catalase family protein n=1 Tax=Alkanindiges sp. WGS2144 TaxID=3366808 RepID=UPI0037526E91